MTFMLSIGHWGGVYVSWGYTKRLCLGWVALTYIPRDDHWFVEAVRKKP